AICNLLTLVFTFVASLTAWIWLVFRSGYSRRLRMSALAGPFAALVVLFGAFRFVEVSGSMVPRFEPRWQSAAPDHRLKDFATERARSSVDLQTTTADDFPQFLGPERSCWLAGPELAHEWKSSPPKLLWKRPIGAGWSAFAAVNGYAVTME